MYKLPFGNYGALLRSWGPRELVCFMGYRQWPRSTAIDPLHRLQLRAGVFGRNWAHTVLPKKKYHSLYGVGADTCWQIKYQNPFSLTCPIFPHLISRVTRGRTITSYSRFRFCMGLMTNLTNRFMEPRPPWGPYVRGCGYGCTKQYGTYACQTLGVIYIFQSSI